MPGVISAELRGARDEVVEIVAEPMLMKSYGVSLEQLIAVTQQSNSLVAAGALEGQTGRFAVKVPAAHRAPGRRAEDSGHRNARAPPSRSAMSRR